MIVRFPPAIICALVLLGGCAGEASRSPSLAPRPIEKTRLDQPPQPTAVAALPADAALQKQIDGFSVRLDRADQAFAAALPGARAAGAKAGTTGSEAWIAAQQQATALEALAGEASATLADIDSLYLARADAAAGGGDASGLDALRTVRARADAIVQTQRQAIEAMKAGLSR